MPVSRSSLLCAVLGIAGAAGSVCPAATAAAAEPNPAAEAEAQARRALEHYRAGRLLEAGRHFFAAYELSGKPTQLRNAAKAFEEGGAHEQAVSYWRRYIHVEGLDEAKRATAMARIDGLEARLETERMRERERRLEAELEDARREIERLRASSGEVGGDGPWPAWRSYAIGAGTAVAVAGAILFASGWQTYMRYGGAADSAPEVTRAEADAAQLRSGLGIGATSLGAAAILAGALWPDED